MKLLIVNTTWLMLIIGEGNGKPLQYSCLENPTDEEPGGLQSMGSLRVGMTEQLHFHFSLSCIGEGNGNSLQCSWLENPRDRGAWWAAVHGVAKSWHDWAASLSFFTFMHWRRKWQLTPVFLPGESQGQGSLVGCCLWGHTELDTTEAT